MPAGLLLVVIVLAGVKAGLGFWGVAVLAAGIVILPGLAYKKFAGIARKFGLPSSGRTMAVTTLTIAGALACVLLSVPAPVPATVLGFVAGNALLALARRRMNASAHVSVTTFAVLWVTDVFGSVLIWLLVLSPMMMLSRTALREHTWREAVAGALLGIITYCCFVGTKNWSWIS
ncbi:phosphatase PAP2 family protein [Arthrobacter sp. SLBN-100]|uniref:hypothetical protein n=1 Tax=Arthrobacter sp. SLBN-100 TaxID=2768450 RepID=UPI00135C9534|nr:hypothetical protein [Arthrobacter sp. SLBN-100]